MEVVTEEEWTSKEEGWMQVGSKEGETRVGMEEGSIDLHRYRRRHPFLVRDRRLERSLAPLPGRED